MTAIHGWGLAGHLGASARTFVSAARAGHLSPRAPADAQRESLLGGARARWLADALRPDERARHLATEALREANARGGARPLLVVLAYPRRLGDQPTIATPDHRVLRAIVEPLGARLDPSSLLVRGGRAAFAFALDAAVALLREGAVEVLVGAVDSPVDAASLTRLDAEGRLAGPARTEGCVPAEAAAFLRIASTAARGRARLARVVARDAGRPGAAGSVLASAARAFPEGPERLFADVNGERAKTKDWLAIHDEALGALGAAATIDWLKRTGDPGAATGAMLAAIALESARMGDGARARAVVSLLSDDGARGAFALELPRRHGTVVATTTAEVRFLGRPRRPAGGLLAAAAARSLADVVEEVAGLLMLDESAAPRLAAQLDAALALARPGPRAQAHPDVRAALAALHGRSPPIARAAAWMAAHLPPPAPRRTTPT